MYTANRSCFSSSLLLLPPSTSETTTRCTALRSWKIRRMSLHRQQLKTRPLLLIFALHSWADYFPTFSSCLVLLHIRSLARLFNHTYGYFAHYRVNCHHWYSFCGYLFFDVQLFAPEMIDQKNPHHMELYWDVFGVDYFINLSNSTSLLFFASKTFPLFRFLKTILPSKRPVSHSA